MTTKKDREWRLDDAGPRSGNLIRASILQGEAVIAELPCPDAYPEHGITNKQWEKNARVLAASRDLLDALQGARAMLVLMGVDMSGHEETRKIDAAIAKATQ